MVMSGPGGRGKGTVYVVFLSLKLDSLAPSF